MVKIALAGVGLSLLLAIPSISPGKDATPRGEVDVEWRDGNGWLIKRLDSAGQLFLYWRNQEGRLVQACKLAGRFSKKTAGAGLTANAAWTHYFTYSEDGQLIEELDCAGVTHRFEAAEAIPKVKEVIGTALKGHVHGRVGADAAREAPGTGK